MAEMSNRKTGAMFPQYDTTANREKTFHNWPQDSHLQPRELAEAGFFYHGDGDSVTCYCCGGELSQWGPGDNSWTEHEKFYPSCAHVLLHKMGELTLGDEHADHETYAIQNSGKGIRKDYVQEDSLKYYVLEDSLKETVFEDDKKFEEDNKHPQQQFLCKTCLQEQACIVFLPCGHLSACPVCSQKLQNCDICQQHIKATIRAYAF
ncbi:hypothetical protein CHS0354_002421 [Potamilus streckersoni]|uniref:RING-type domain-containing protein n=1 Tax=Potamilus streckersoni TaxID=2493646 RepID=A0AAE0W988_9BIVA|nr:hypothetical protein CHS0354_002421 [Potamilus streckersoni]